MMGALPRRRLGLRACLGMLACSRQVWAEDARKQVTFFGNKIFTHPPPDLIPPLQSSAIRVGIYTADTFM
jgi:hypothetical protein